MDESIAVEGLTKVFDDPARGEVRAVDGVSFSCRKGEVFGLLGANGAGKTTTLRMLATVLRPSEGRAVVAGHDIVQQPEQVRRCIGFHSASTALYPRLTARETLRLFARLGGVPRRDIEPRLEALVGRWGLSEFADTRVDKLSSGMKQKVAIARTLAHDPPILIFDEPTVGLDVLAAIATIEAIGSLRDEGKTIVFSTHIMSEVEKLCDRIAIMRAGALLACDTLTGLRSMTGKHYLEDIFVSLMPQASADE